MIVPFDWLVQSPNGAASATLRPAANMTKAWLILITIF
jgi:hypothetical protein